MAQGTEVCLLSQVFDGAVIILSLAPMVASTVANGPRSPWDAISLIIMLRIWRVKRVIDGEWSERGQQGWKGGRWLLQKLGLSTESGEKPNDARDRPASLRAWRLETTSTERTQPIAAHLMSYIQEPLTCCPDITCKLLSLEVPHITIYYMPGSPALHLRAYSRACMLSEDQLFTSWVF